MTEVILYPGSIKIDEILPIPSVVLNQLHLKNPFFQTQSIIHDNKGKYFHNVHLSF